MKIDGNTRLVALLGNPVAHTRSPVIHNTAFSLQALNLRYVAFAVSPENLADAVRGLAALGFRGANVTIPHKERIVDFLDEVSPRAAAVGAVNTIVCRPAPQGVCLYGDNTDVEGFLRPLEPYAASLAGRPVTVLGAGGSARAVVYAIATALRPSSLVIAARTPAKAERLVREVIPPGTGLTVRVVPYVEAAPVIRESGLVVNCTPLGMSPHTAGSPWDDPEDFQSGQVVYDLVYNPRDTRFLSDAAARGAATIDGLEMLVEQAAASYRLWTGAEMPVDDVRAALIDDPA